MQQVEGRSLYNWIQINYIILSEAKIIQAYDCNRMWLGVALWVAINMYFSCWWKIGDDDVIGSHHQNVVQRVDQIVKTSALMLLTRWRHWLVQAQNGGSLSDETFAMLSSCCLYNACTPLLECLMIQKKLFFRKFSHPKVKCKSGKYLCSMKEMVNFRYVKISSE